MSNYKINGITDAAAEIASICQTNPISEVVNYAVYYDLENHAVNVKHGIEANYTSLLIDRLWEPLTEDELTQKIDLKLAAIEYLIQKIRT